MELQFLIACLVAGMCLLGALGYDLRTRRRLRNRLAAVAGRLHGAVFEDGVRFSPQERRAYLWFQENPGESHLTLALEQESVGTFKLVPEDMGFRFQKLFGEQDLKIGDDRFDAEFAVQANPEGVARAIFTEPRKSRAIAAVRDLQRLGRPSIDLTQDLLRVRVDSCLVDRPEEILRMIDASEKFLECVLGSEGPEGVRWIRTSSAGGTCQVCGSEMKERVVRCARCRTPHHEECWTYTGQCSTFACKERRSVQ